MLRKLLSDDIKYLKRKICLLKKRKKEYYMDVGKKKRNGEKI